MMETIYIVGAVLMFAATAIFYIAIIFTKTDKSVKDIETNIASSFLLAAIIGLLWFVTLPMIILIVVGYKLSQSAWWNRVIGE